MARAKGTNCDGCAHVLGTPVDVEVLKRDIDGYAGKIGAGVGLTVVMLLLNWFLFRGAGVILLIAPLGWAVWGYRERRIRLRYLKQFQAKRN